MKKIAFIVILFIQQLNAQNNLIVNPSFEEFVFLPFNGPAMDGLERKNWKKIGSSDYFNPAYSSINFGTPYNYFGYQAPHEGNAYIGLGGDTTYAYREFMQGKLSRRLEKGKKYCFNCYLSVSDTVAYASRNFSVYFNHQDLSNFIGNLDSIPSIIDTTCFTNNYNDWFMFKGNYIAKGYEEKLIIGLFFNNGVDIFKIPNAPSNLSQSIYYYVDDLSLFEINTYNGPSDTTIKMLPPFEYKLQAKMHIGTQYIWSTGDTTINTSITQSGMYTLQSITECGIGIDTFYVTFEDATIDTTEKPIGIIPNVISIDNDTINNTFRIANLPKNSNLIIYNRWGTVIYTSNNYDNLWKGTNQQNQPIDDGVYYYILDIPNKQSRKGFIQVFR